MALSHKAKRRWSLVILLIGLPVYIVLASTLATWIAPGSILVEFVIYVVLGIAWAFPCRRIFLGVGQAPPEDEER